MALNISGAFKGASKGLSGGVQLMAMLDQLQARKKRRATAESYKKELTDVVEGRPKKINLPSQGGGFGQEGFGQEGFGQEGFGQNRMSLDPRLSEEGGNIAFMQDLLDVQMKFNPEQAISGFAKLQKRKQDEDDRVKAENTLSSGLNATEEKIQDLVMNNSHLLPENQFSTLETKELDLFRAKIEMRDPAVVEDLQKWIERRRKSLNERTDGGGRAKTFKDLRGNASDLFTKISTSQEAELTGNIQSLLDSKKWISLKDWEQNILADTIRKRIRSPEMRLLMDTILQSTRVSAQGGKPTP